MTPFVMFMKRVISTFCFSFFLCFPCVLCPHMGNADSKLARSRHLRLFNALYRVRNAFSTHMLFWFAYVYQTFVRNLWYISWDTWSGPVLFVNIKHSEWVRNGRKKRCLLLAVNKQKTKVTKEKYNAYQNRCSNWIPPHVMQTSRLPCIEDPAFANIPRESEIPPPPRLLQRCVLYGPQFRKKRTLHAPRRSNPYTICRAIGQADALDHHGRFIDGKMVHSNGYVQKVWNRLGLHRAGTTGKMEETWIETPCQAFALTGKFCLRTRGR